MRTTFIIDDELYHQVKAVALDERRTATSVVEEALLAYLARRAEPAPLAFHTFTSGLVEPGLDLTRNAAIAGYLDEADEAVRDLVDA